MSTTTTSAASSATSATNCGASLYDIPVQDAACAMPYGGNHTDILAACCGSASVISYYGDCGVYCLAEDQSVADLTSCFYDHGAAYQDVFCHGNTTATATGAGDSLPTGTGVTASVVATATSDSTKSGSSASGTSSSGASESSKSAAPRSQASVGINTVGLAIGALLFSATTLGAFAL
ncbi:hypothetical protein LQW54_000887 [Pestalotiopsis sp. IQ-011]